MERLHSQGVVFHLLIAAAPEAMIAHERQRLRLLLGNDLQIVGDDSGTDLEGQVDYCS